MTEDQRALLLDELMEMYNRGKIDAIRNLASALKGAEAKLARRLTRDEIIDAIEASCVSEETKAAD